MECPFCGNYENKVVKTFLHIRRNVRIRLRICLHCGAILRTEEKLNVIYTRRINPQRTRRMIVEGKE